MWRLMGKEIGGFSANPQGAVTGPRWGCLKREEIIRGGSVSQCPVAPVNGSSSDAWDLWLGLKGVGYRDQIL